MEMVVVGIDVAKAGLDVHLLPAGEAFAVGREAAGIDMLIARLRPLAPAMVAVEATGGLESVVAASLGAAGLPVVVVNPAQVRAFAQALGKRAKTDPIDAAVSARFAAATRPTIRPLVDAETTALADRIARRRQIIQMITAEGQREAGFGTDEEEHPAPEESAAKRARRNRPDIDDAVRGSPLWRHWRAWHRSPASRAPDGQGGRGKAFIAAGRARRPQPALHGRHGRRQAQPHPQGLL